MELSLKGRSALVCGGSQGIGKACALELAALGARLTLVSRSEEKLQATLTEVEAIAPNLGHDLWVVDFDDTEALRQSISERPHMNFNILINNAGGPAAGPILDATTDALLNGFKRHILAAHLITQSVVGYMKSNGYGRIINIISTSVKQPIPGLGVSNTIRGAMGNWSKTMALELGPDGITVNNLLPGKTETERLSSLMKHWAEARGISLQEYQEADYPTIPLRRYGHPQEIGGVVAFLASPAAAYITGTNVVVDGGRTKSL